MGVLFASLLVIPAIEYFLRLPIIPRLRALLSVSGKSGRVLMAKHVSDHWKERVLLRYSCQMATHSLLLALLFLGLAAVVVFPALLIDRLLAPVPSTMDSLLDLPGLAGMTLVGTVYVYVRKRFG